MQTVWHSSSTNGKGQGLQPLENSHGWKLERVKQHNEPGRLALLRPLQTRVSVATARSCGQRPFLSLLVGNSLSPHPFLIDVSRF